MFGWSDKAVSPLIASYSLLREGRSDELDLRAGHDGARPIRIHGIDGSCYAAVFAPGDVAWAKPIAQTRTADHIVSRIAPSWAVVMSAQHTLQLGQQLPCFDAPPHGKEKEG